MTSQTTPWLVRALIWARLLPTVDAPSTTSPTPTLGGATGSTWTDPSIPATMSAYGAFSWVYRCATVISQDVAALPLCIEVDDGKVVRTLMRHEAISHMKKPAPGVNGMAMRMQLAVDLVVSGNAYVMASKDRKVLTRVHPASVTEIVDLSTGRIVKYAVTGLDGASQDVLPTRIAHIRGASWREGIGSATGYSATSALDSTLRIESAASKQSRIAAAKGRISTLFSPKGDDAFMAASVARLKEKWDEAEGKGSSTFFVGESVNVTRLGDSARDSQLTEIRAQNREDICAAFGVPPTIAGIPGANHGTAREEARGYWERTIMPIARLFDEAFARLLLTDPREIFAHDFSGVVALQVARMDQFAQAAILVEKFGATPREALDYLGFTDAPAGVLPTSGTKPAIPGRDPTEEPRDEVFAAALRGVMVLGRGRPSETIRAALLGIGVPDTGALDEAAATIHYGVTCDTMADVVRLARGLGLMPDPARRTP